jgi:transposase-like protein
MAAPRKYPDELRERAIRLVRDAKAEPGSSGKNVCRRVGEQLGINPETLRIPRTAAPLRQPQGPTGRSSQSPPGSKLPPVERTSSDSANALLERRRRVAVARAR